mmetsp:Transcript_24408/g.66633  ORF Transcript_24408/g.66633 Transcript_24408/m.66633 type:complete len:587 (-) Transcript_24408:85-1845(-)|eukprot:CAMPEP_0171227854 /NCGR_PEP_ID=MMETSP0790-20130122/38061_1 /TAXON_ID=2925 /ORGANISM="Alexandrium catenella, Strain OF101" /LENGTH=586 /DNA_ID=CAMNT_0011693979 /DNA_START=39 /DNA_END=1799 /DNA_ORIENTATION=-
MAPAGAGQAQAELRRSGFACLPCSGPALGRLADLFAELPVEQMFADAAGTVHTVDSPQGPAAFVVAPTAVTNRMRWLWACDEAAMAAFDALGKSCLATLEDVADGPLLLCSACFVVVRGPQIAVAEVKQHADWAHKRIPSGASFTCLAPLTPLPSSVGGLRVWPWDGQERECRYEFGSCIAIDGKLFHRTEPFKYQPKESEGDVCNAYEASGHLRVLVSLSIASFSERLAGYSRKVMRHMTPKAALVRDSPDIFLDSESDFMTSDTDSDAASCASSASSRYSVQGETIGVRGLRTVLQNGLWRGARHASHSWEEAQEMSLELGFDLENAQVISQGRIIGHFTEDLGMWHLTLELQDERGADLVLSGEFVRGLASVCVQGRFRDTGWGGYFCLFPPRPWQVLLESWRLFPLAGKAIGLPPEPGVVELSWTDDAGTAAVAVGREARQFACSQAAGAQLGLSEESWRPLGRAICMPESEEGCFEALEPGCTAVIPDLAQRRGTFERLLEAALEAGCCAVIVLQGGRPQLPRAARPRESTAQKIPIFTVSSMAVEDRGPPLAGAQIAFRPAAPASLLTAGWAERLGVVQA